MLDNMKIGKTIAALRQANGMTQQKLAAIMNVSHQAVSKWETGAALPDMQTMLELSRLFGVTMEQLLTAEVPEDRLRSRDSADKGNTMDVFGAVREVVTDVVNDIGSWFKSPEEKAAEGQAPKADENSADETAPEAEDDGADAAKIEEEIEREADETEYEARVEAEAEKAVEAAVDEADIEKEVEETVEGSEEASEPENHETEAEDSPLDMQKILEMAPFMSRQALAELVQQYAGSVSVQDVVRLAPFLSPDALGKLIARVDGTLDWNMLRRLAPFLRKEMVDRLTMAMARGEKAVRPVLDNVAKAAEDFGRDIQKRAGDVDFDKLGEQISSGITQAMQSAQRFGESVAREVNRAFGPSEVEKVQEEARRQRSERSRQVRRHMFERAVEDGRWDWIAERLDDLEDEELKTEIARKASEAGMGDWVAEHFGDLVSDETVWIAIEKEDWDWLSDNMEEINAALHPEIAQAAAAAGAWKFLEENAGFMDMSACALEIALSAAEAGQGDLVATLAEEQLTEEEIFTLAEKTLETGKFALLEGLTEHLNAAQVNNICLELADKQAWDTLEEVVGHADEAVVDAVCLAMAQQGEWSRLADYVGNASAEAVAQLMDMAVDAGNWEAVDLLEEYLD